jgi:hypothetical protein
MMRYLAIASALLLLLPTVILLFIERMLGSTTDWLCDLSHWLIDYGMED